MGKVSRRLLVITVMVGSLAATVIILMGCESMALTPATLPIPTLTPTRQPIRSATLPALSPTPAPSDTPPATTELSSPSPTNPHYPFIPVSMSHLGDYEGEKYFEYYYFHVDSNWETYLGEGYKRVEPETIEVIDPITKKVVAGPFPLTEKDSELCLSRVFETQPLDVFLFPGNYSFFKRTATEPYYIYRIRFRKSTGEGDTIDFVGLPGVCESALP